MYATGPDNEVALADDFNSANPHYGQKGLGTGTWEGDAWKIGGGTNWGWYAYDPIPTCSTTARAIRRLGTRLCVRVTTSGR